jgi:hypothetical protein
MRHAFCAFLLLLFSAIASAASTPSWVQPGVSVTYDGLSSAVVQGQVQNSVQVVVTITVNQRSGNTVAGLTTVTNPMAYAVDEYPWSCTEGMPCGWRFWVDPAGSAVGPNGERMEELGALPFAYGSYSTDDAAMVGYSNEQTGAEYRYVFEQRTGLVLAYTEKFPGQQTYIYFTSINVDLGAYQPPGGGDGGDGELPGDAVCGPAFALLLLAGMGLARAARMRGRGARRRS